MEDAVKGGSLDDSALSVPYGNLATMHRQRGSDLEAERFEELAQRNRATELK